MIQLALSDDSKRPTWQNNSCYDIWAAVDDHILRNSTFQMCFIEISWSNITENLNVITQLSFLGPFALEDLDVTLAKIFDVTSMRDSDYISGCYSFHLLMDCDYFRYGILLPKNQFFSSVFAFRFWFLTTHFQFLQETLREYNPVWWIINLRSKYLKNYLLSILETLRLSSL